MRVALGPQKFHQGANKALIRDMISLDECRKILGDAGRDLSDDDLDRLRQQLYGLADIAVTCYLTRREKTVTLQAKEPSG